MTQACCDLIDVETIDDTLLVRPNASVIDVKNVEEFQTAINHMPIEYLRANIVVDLVHVESMSNSGIACLLRLQKGRAGVMKRMRICNAPQSLIDKLDSLNLTGLIEIAFNISNALDWDNGTK